MKIFNTIKKSDAGFLGGSLGRCSTQAGWFDIKLELLGVRFCAVSGGVEQKRPYQGSCG